MTRPETTATRSEPSPEKQNRETALGLTVLPFVGTLIGLVIAGRQRAGSLLSHTARAAALGSVGGYLVGAITEIADPSHTRDEAEQTIAACAGMGSAVLGSAVFLLHLPIYLIRR